MKRWMLTVAALPLVTCLLVAAPAKDEQSEAEAILDNAIKAVGGPDKLTKLTSFVVKLNRKPTARPGVGGVETTLEVSYEYPDRKRSETTRDIGGTKTISLQVVNGDKAWLSSRGAVRELNAEQVKQLRSNLFAEFPVRQLPLYKGKGYKLTMLGESKVDEKKVVGIKVTAEGKADQKLYFDKETGLLLKQEYELPRFTPSRAGVPGGADAPNPSITVEVFYEDYMESGGIRYPTKTRRIQGGRTTIEDEIAEFKVVDKFDEKTFAKPE